jgi:hypothetical protein
MQAPSLVVNPDNPGKSTVFDFKRYKKSKRRSKAGGQAIDLVDLLSDVLLTYGQKAYREGNWLRLDNGFWLLPQWVSSEVIDGSICTNTTVEIHHPTLIPSGFFDYQYVHSANSITASFLTGLNEWGQTCAVPLFDSLLVEPKTSAQMVMGFPNDADVAMSGSSSGKTRLRRLIFGPVVYFVAEAQKNTTPLKDDEHDEYCPCCLLNRLKYVFMPFLNSDDYIVIQLRSSRDSDGDINVMCYVNGKEFDAGVDALTEDTKNWPPRGAENRHHFIIVQNDLST